MSDEKYTFRGSIRADKKYGSFISYKRCAIEGSIINSIYYNINNMTINVDDKKLSIYHWYQTTDDDATTFDRWYDGNIQNYKLDYKNKYFLYSLHPDENKDWNISINFTEPGWKRFISIIKKIEK